MGRARAFVMALRDNLSVDHEDRPDRRIGTRLAKATACFRSAARMKISSLRAVATATEISRTAASGKRSVRDRIRSL